MYSKIYLLWISQKKSPPNYFYFISNFLSSLNPDCKIYKLIFSLENLENNKLLDDFEFSHLAKDCFQKVLKFLSGSKDSLYLQLLQKQKKYYSNNHITSEHLKIMILSDLLRLRIVEQFGGIYVDSDIIPFKSFNNFLPSKGRYFALANSGGLDYPDNYFLASSDDFNGKLWPLEDSRGIHISPSKSKNHINFLRIKKFFLSNDFQSAFSLAKDTFSENFCFLHLNLKFWKSVNI